MTILAFALMFLAAWLIVEVGCSESKPAGVSWFDVYPHLKPGSKKMRGRGDVNHEGLSRREQARQ